jgi:putative tryptophan/tyrosine transport system substrate-binding protein
MRRRVFIRVIGGTAIAWPLGARAQQPTLPVIGFLHAGDAQTYSRPIAAFKKGLGEIGYIEGRNVAIDSR